ncbi:MAG: maleylpyruvate isomerase N-terminal domain-containing protein, partial [Vicinamibacterales bacterium]
MTLLRGLSAEEWTRGTLAGAWTVRDVVAHLVDLALRRVSFHRGGLVPPPPPFPLRSEADFVRFINGLNHEWVHATTRCSPQVLTELFELAGGDLADFFEARPLDAPGLFGVSWAGEQSSAGWFDMAREFTELWHHQMQIRLAVGAEPLREPRYLKAVLDVSMRALAHAYRDVMAEDGETVTVEADGPAGGAWTLKRELDRWTVWAGRPDRVDARVSMSDDLAWRLLYN